MTELNSTQRFTDRVADYVAYRPSYPPEVLAWLAEQGALPSGATVADVGSGTGILTRLLLGAGHTVYAVEPNEAMRAAAEEDLAGTSGFHSVAGTAEATTLPAASVDLVTAAQAFHWFDPDASRVEFARILRPGGSVALVWNMRRDREPGFMSAYEAMLREFGLSYDEVKQSARMGEIERLYVGGYTERIFRYGQVFDFAGLRGRLMSSSYAPQPSDPRHAPMMARLQELFDAYQQGGAVTFSYDTHVFLGAVVG